MDTDFDYLRRDEIIQYVTEKYGEQHVAQIGTYTTLSARSALKDAGRILGFPPELMNEITKHVPSHQGNSFTIEECLDQVDAIIQYERQYPELFQMALSFESLPRSASTHACGVLITNEDIPTNIPLMRGTKGNPVTQYGGPVLETKGWIKFDFLGLKNLSVLDIARQLIRDRHGIDIDPDKLSPDNPQVFRTIQSGKTLGLFQIESGGMVKMFKGINKVDFETVIAGLALYRPGPMQFIPDYQQRANGMAPAVYAHPDVEEILKTTFGIIIYQEQIMQLAGRLGGYSAGEQDTFRKAVGKKKIEILEPALEEFSSRMIARGYEQEVADQLCNAIRPFAGYGFNRSHAAAYAYITYQCAFFKTMYPLEFFTALLTVFGQNKKKAMFYVKDAKAHGIDVLPPDVNKSGRGFTIDGSAIRFGLEAISGLGEGAVDELMSYRPFVSIEDFCERVPKAKVNKTAVKALALSGCFDEIHQKSDNRMDIYADIAAIRGIVEEDLEIAVAKFDIRKKAETEREYLNVYITGHPLAEYADPVDWDSINIDELVTTSGIITDIKFTKTRKKQEDMAIVEVSFPEIDETVVIFPSIFEKLNVKLVKDLVVRFQLKLNYNTMRDETSWIAEKVFVPKRMNGKLYQSLEQESTVG